MDTIHNANEEWLAWQLLDSAFPVGGFAHSSGLESAMQTGLVKDEASLHHFISLVLYQAAYSQLPFVRESYNAVISSTEFSKQFATFQQLDSLYQAITRTNAVATRASTSMGRSMLIAAAGFLPASSSISEWKLEIRRSDSPCNYPTIFGVVCALAGLRCHVIKVQRMFMFLVLRGLISSAVRLNIVGPLMGQQLQTQLSSVAEELLQSYAHLDIDDVAQPVPIVDLIQASHDKLYSRLFNS